MVEGKGEPAMLPAAEDKVGVAVVAMGVQAEGGAAEAGVAGVASCVAEWRTARNGGRNGWG